MQTQDAPADFIFKLWPWLEANKTRLIGAALVILLVVGVVYFISAQRAQNEIEAGQALTVLMTSPTGDNSQLAGQFEQLAAKYPSTVAGQRAQLQAATTLFAAGNFPDAEAQFEKYINSNPNGLFAPTALIGVGASLEAQNKLDQAASAYQRVASAFPLSPCVLPAEVAMGRIAEAQNKLSEAMTHYQHAARFPLGGTLTREAMARAEEIQAKLPPSQSPPSALPSALPITVKP